MLRSRDHCAPSSDPGPVVEVDRQVVELWEALRATPDGLVGAPTDDWIRAALDR